MNRRAFLSTSALAGTWSLLAPHARAQGANDDLRVAVIGLNGRGKSLIRGLAGSRGARIVALCDVDTAVLGAAEADLAKQGVKTETYDDYRRLCGSPEIDAVVIATPNHTHALIAATAAVHGKHVYVEKPVSHNVWEGRELARIAGRHKVIVQHGFQRRSETCWEEAVAWLAAGNLGRMTLARGFCYKARDTIGKVLKPLAPPPTVNPDLWFGPREIAPVRRKKFHYDWHWQFDYGNGDLGNQGPHQLDVCRWFAGDPGLPDAVLSAGARLGYEDDGEWANTQLVWLDYKPVPILFEVRGLPVKGLDFKSGVDKYKGQDVGNVIDCEGGWLSGGHHDMTCRAYDRDGKVVREFKGGKSHMQNFINAVKAGEIQAIHSVESGHLSSALAHLGNISWRLGEEAPPEENRAAFTDARAAEAFDRMAAHLDANDIDLAKTPLRLGKTLTLDANAERFTGEHADGANAMLKGGYRAGFELPS